MKIYQSQAKKTSSTPQIMNFLYSVFLSYFLVQLAVLYKKNYINGIKKAYMPKLWIVLDFGRNH